MEKKLVHINLPKELHQAVKIMGAKLYRSVNDCYVEALTNWLETQAETAKEESQEEEI